MRERERGTREFGARGDRWWAVERERADRGWTRLRRGWGERGAEERGGVRDREERG